MHELSAVESMVEVALEKAEQVGSPRIVGMHFVINEGGYVTEESVRLCFDIVARGTPAESASLSFEWNPPHYRCSKCGNIFEGSHDEAATVPCPKCNETTMIVPPTEEFYLDSIDVE